MENKQTPEGKTGAEIVLEWMRKYSEQNGTPTEFEIRCQLELAIDAEKSHHQETNAKRLNHIEPTIKSDNTKVIIQLEEANAKLVEALKSFVDVDRLNITEFHLVRLKAIQLLQTYETK